MNEIKAIETLYKGYRFRSRLEARWAVCFDSLGIRWEYEKQGYVVNDTPYLPDFWVPYPFIPDAGFWIEIKPTEPTQGEIDLVAGLVEMTGHRGFLIAGQPWAWEHTVYAFEHHRNGKPKSIPITRNCLVLVRKPAHTLDYGEGRADGDGFPADTQLCVGTDYGFVTPCDDNGHPIDLEHLALSKAFRAARSARFEHGEKPRV